MKILSAAGMRTADRRTIAEVGIPGVVLMERAGAAVAAVIEAEYRELFPGPIAIFCGKGNNGGDGYVVARLLQSGGWQVDVALFAEPSAVTGDALEHLQRLAETDVVPVPIADRAELESFLSRSRFCLAVDALLGTGATVPVTGLFAEAVTAINSRAAVTLAVDLPSGLDADTGRVAGAVIRADRTVTFAAPKPGLLSYPGAEFCGRVTVADIGIPAAILTEAACGEWLDAEAAAALLPLRPATGHKGRFGHILLIAGSIGKTGAAILAAEATLRSGAGLVTVALPASCQPILAARLSEAMSEPLSEIDGSIALAAARQIGRIAREKDVVALGPGLGRHPETQQLIRMLVAELPQPLVLDADALYALAEDLQILRRRSAGTTILTPHPGEMSRLTGRSVAEIESDRLAAAGTFARDYGVVLVLKGARTVVAGPDGAFAVNSTGNPGMATGGMGDLLTGVIAGLLGQGLSSYAAACAGVWLHGRAGDRAAAHLGDSGLLAGDLLPEIPRARGDALQALSAHRDKGALSC